MTNLEYILSALMLFFVLRSLYLKGLVIMQNNTINNYQITTKNLNEVCNNWRDNYFQLYSTIIPSSAKELRKKLFEFKDAVDDMIAETEEVNFDIRRHHAKVAQEKFIKELTNDNTTSKTNEEKQLKEITK